VRICDRCQTVAHEKVTLGSSAEVFDLCVGCAELLRNWIITPPTQEIPEPKKRGRKPKAEEAATT
jgi:hypothetical protein